MKWLSDLIRTAQGPARFLYAVAAIGLFFLLIPASWAEWLGIQEVLVTWRGWNSLATVSAFAFGTASFAPSLLRFWRGKAAIRACLKSVDALSTDERILLGYCVSRRKRTLLLSLGSVAGKTAEGLYQKGLMEKAQGQYSALDWPFTIPASVWPGITKRVDSILGKGWKEDEALRADFAHLDGESRGRGTAPSWRSRGE